jgi:hypothetical protein
MSVSCQIRTSTGDRFAWRPRFERLGEIRGRPGIPLFHFYKRVREQGSHSYAAIRISGNWGKEEL